MVPTERLKGLEAFVATADAGSFTAAAERLNLTNSAVGKAVSRLEARLNTRLFERTTRSLALTDAGAAFYRTCVRVLDELQVAEQVLAADRLEPFGRLRVDVPATFGRMRVLPLLLAFAELHPGVRPHISFTDRFVDIVEEGIDVGVRIGGADAWPAALGQRYLGTERLIFCASPGYLARRPAPQSIEELWTHDTVTYGRADGSASPWLIQRGAGPVERRSVEGRVVVGQADALVEAVLAHSGIAQLATWLVDEHLASGRLVQILPALATDGLPLHLVWPRSRQLLPKIDGLISYLGSGLGIR
ncbi:LysR family transcriptional regulator [Acidovorax sp. CCYZU-2555]|uniref:LysR family transcriptional regulator n=1 Tax=Acidovorax sp. CCYZU-2555 TaxID=2835042 RepID=UPI001BCEA2CE|nr:LysR family transcriptional regulator [Acidovorax sp. CCYZU-2555]MBS7781479.1 LysR family transcriptional regulator [Acidovorax sp. CCYZU-2555]